VKNPFRVALGVITSLGGFVEVGSISTATQAGAFFGFRLLWAGVIAAVALACLLEMTGRLAAVSRHTFVDAVRERFGFSLYAILLGVELLLDSLLLAAEIGGVSIALAIWFLLWRGTFGVLEHGLSLCGLVTLSFIVAVVVLHPPAKEVLGGLVPRLPDRDVATYGLQAIAILGATVSPYLINFYSSGAIEDEWNEKQIPGNRIVASLGTAFGALVSLAILLVAALVLSPHGIRVEGYEQAAVMLVPAFPRWGFALFVASLAVGCFGAAVELTLNLGYVFAQTFGWNWGENAVPRKHARFSLAYTALLVPPTLLMLTGVEPLALTLVTMILTVIALPVVVVPLLVVMNDPHYLERHTNGGLANVVILVIVVAGALMALAAVPLQIAGGG